VVNDTSTPNDLPEPSTPRQMDMSTKVEAEATPGDPATGKRPISLADNKRNAIVSRFKQQRDTSADDDVAELLAFANHGIPPELAKPAPQQKQRAAPVDLGEPEPEHEPEPTTEEKATEFTSDEPEPEPVKPAKRKLKVRGAEVELTEDELLAAAQRGLAGDSYLDESRRKLDEVNDLLRTTKTRAEPASPSAVHPGAPAGTTAEPSPGADSDGNTTQKSPLTKVVELLQFGDPEEAAQELDRHIDNRAAQRSQATLQRERLRNETTRSARFLKEFADQHPDLANDGFASAAMERRLFELQREDLVQLAQQFGKDDTAVPTSPAEIAKWHLYYRTEGHPVRDVPTLLKQSKDDFVKWKGTGKSNEPPTVKAAPRIEVQVDRSQRRQAIPTQPSRTGTPRPDAQQPANAPRDRSAIVREMQQKRGRNLGRPAAGMQ
jgi:hypothetical protein